MKRILVSPPAFSVLIFRWTVPNPSSVFLRPETGELIRCMSSRVLELAVHDPVRFLESHPSVVVGEINHLLADTEVWVSACGTLNVDGRQL